MQRLFFVLGAWLAALSVAIGAFGAHGAKNFMSAEQLLWVDKGARYQMYHALALFAVVWALTYWINQAKLLKAAGWLFVAGTLFFSGSLYIMALTEFNLGYITPLGGVAYVAGWIALAEAARRG
ncbi:MAG: DUF423 domain-containing protein [Aquificales bacterium]|nr:DUF423 domain-containing protein [Aquificales bacterium]